MQDFYRCEPVYEARAETVATRCCKKLVVDMHYEARIQAIVTYHRSIMGERIPKSEARLLSLTWDQYLEVSTHH